RLNQGAARPLADDELAGKSQKYAKTEDFQGVLAAKDRRPQKWRFEPRPIARDEMHGDGREREEMSKAQDVEIGLVDWIHPIAHPDRYETPQRLDIPR